MGHVGIWGKFRLLLKGIIRIDEGREREERRTGESGPEDTFGGKINVGEEYVGQQQIPVPRTPSKGGDPVHYRSVLVENQRLNLLATHCLISIVSLVSIRYLLKTSPQQRHCQQKDLRLRSIRLITMLC